MIKALGALFLAVAIVYFVVVACGEAQQPERVIIQQQPAVPTAPAPEVKPEQTAPQTPPRIEQDDDDDEDGDDGRGRGRGGDDDGDDDDGSGRGRGRGRGRGGDNRTDDDD